MSKLKITSWQIESTQAGDRAYRESIFSQGNGYMGTRGYRPDEPGVHRAWRSTFLAGFYEYVKPGITDLVNQPDFSDMALRLNGEDSNALEMSGFRQSLDMRSGLVSWNYTLTDGQGRRTQVRQEKVLSMADSHLAGIRLTVLPLNWNGQVELVGGLDAGVDNLPVADDQMTENTVLVKLWGCVRTERVPGGGILQAETTVSGRKIAMGYLLDGAGESETQTTEVTIASKISAQLREQQAWTVEKRIAVASFRDGDGDAILREKLEQLRNVDFDGILEASKEAWGNIWQKADVVVEGNEEWQGAIRYNIFQLVQAMPYGDGFASIGPRGLTHGRYKGCYFWDTEIFMLPFFCWTQPEAARSLLEYRYHTLPDAVRSAEGFNGKGARYSWMASDRGFEQCETWDTGCCEVHITADIAHAVQTYFAQTGDGEFMLESGVEILIQTARYWTDRLTYSAAEDCYHLLFIKGPDEYCGVTMDDFYTVSMAGDNLIAAADGVEWMMTEAPEKWKLLKKKLNFAETEPLKWKEIVKKTVRKKLDGTKIWKQDATFELLEPLDIRSNKQDDSPMYRRIGFDRLQRYQVLKQPAVLMYMAIRPDRFTQEEIRQAWDYYEPKTLHDSTLSFGIHALIAARLGRREEAVRYFEKSLFLDLKDVMQNTGSEGIHTASLGATWQALVLGFSGLQGRDGVPTAQNLLPKEVEGIRYTVCYRGKEYRIEINRESEPKITEIN